MVPVTIAAIVIYWLEDWLLHMDCGSSMRRGLNYLLMCAVLFAPGILVYMQARRERGEVPFVGFELSIAIFIALVAIVAAYLMWTGVISPL